MFLRSTTTFGGGRCAATFANMNARLQEYDGRVVTTTHFGPYARLGDAHSEIRQWSAERGHRLSGICWEIYGHWDESWNADPSKIRTDVFHLLQKQAA